MLRRATWARYVGAVALLGVGLDHLEQFSLDHYSAVPTIGTLFALDFASAALLALGPVRRLPGRAWPLGRAGAAYGGIGVAAGSPAGLAASESVGLFGFMQISGPPPMSQARLRCRFRRRVRRALAPLNVDRCAPDVASRDFASTAEFGSIEACSMSDTEGDWPAVAVV